MTSPINAESLSTIGSFAGLKRHISLQMSASAMTSTAIDLIGTAHRFCDFACSY